MSNIFDELKSRLKLDYLSDIRFIDRTETIQSIRELYESGKYSEKEIQELVDYITA